jgi:hypothetical protein
MKKKFNKQVRFVANGPYTNKIEEYNHTYAIYKVKK